MIKKSLCNAHAFEPECSVCDDRGYVIISCCGHDITHEVETRGNDLCPECLEHCGDEKEACECQTFNATD